MTKPIKYDNNGYPYHGRARPDKISGLKMNVNNSRKKNEKCYKTFLNMVYKVVKWETNPVKYPRTMWRNILLMVIIFMRCVVDGLMTEKWNEYFHWRCVREEECKYTDENTDPEFLNYYGLQKNEKYWMCKHDLMLILHGDSIDVQKTPTDVKDISFGIVKCAVFTDKHLQQTLMVAVLFMISGYIHYNQVVTDVYQLCSKRLGKGGGLSWWSNKAKCKMCSKWYRCDNGDWPWVATVVHRCPTHAGHFPFIYWIKHIGKAFVAVKKTPRKIFEAIKAGIKEEHMPWNLDIDKISEFDTFYCLALEYHWKSWMNEMEDAMSKIRNFNKLSHQKQHRKRLNYANENYIALLYKTPLALIQYIFDIMHAIISCVRLWIYAMTVVLYCPFRLPIESVCGCMAHICKYIF